jgi:hypothetical protein
MFPTWFRIHTIALISEILTDENKLMEKNFHFNNSLSMGWHDKWSKESNRINFFDRTLEMPFSVKHASLKVVSTIKKTLRKLIKGNK